MVVMTPLKCIYCRDAVCRKFDAYHRFIQASLPENLWVRFSRAFDGMEVLRLIASEQCSSAMVASYCVKNEFLEFLMNDGSCAKLMKLIADFYSYALTTVSKDPELSRTMTFSAEEFFNINRVGDNRHIWKAGSQQF